MQSSTATTGSDCDEHIRQQSRTALSAPDTAATLTLSPPLPHRSRIEFARRTAAAAAAAMAFQMPAATGATAAFAPAAGAPVTAAGAALAAAPSTAVAPSSPAASVRSGVESYSALLSCVQDAWSGSMPLDVLRRTLMQHINSMATVQEQVQNSTMRHRAVRSLLSAPLLLTRAAVDLAVCLCLD